MKVHTLRILLEETMRLMRPYLVNPARQPLERQPQRCCARAWQIEARLPERAFRLRHD
jgi:hypothetical protein